MTHAWYKLFCVRLIRKILGIRLAAASKMFDHGLRPDELTGWYSLETLSETITDYMGGNLDHGPDSGAVLKSNGPTIFALDETHMKITRHSWQLYAADIRRHAERHEMQTVRDVFLLPMPTSEAMEAIRLVYLEVGVRDWAVIENEGFSAKFWRDYASAHDALPVDVKTLSSGT